MTSFAAHIGRLDLSDYGLIRAAPGASAAVKYVDDTYGFSGGVVVDESRRKAMVERLLGGPARLERVVDLPAGRVELWSSEGRYPPKLAPYYVGVDGSVFRTDSSWRSFERLLRAARPDLAQSALLAQLVRYAPGRRVVAMQEHDVPEALRASDWAPRSTGDGGWVAHCIDTIRGRWERVVIEKDYRITRNDLGQAPKRVIR